MKYLVPLYILAALILCFHCVSGSWAQVTFSGGAEMSGGVTVPADEGPTVVFSDNFEPTPETLSCDAGGSQEVATGRSGTDPETCDYDIEPLAGSESAIMPACVNNGEVWLVFDNTFSYPLGSGTMWSKWLMQVDDDGTDAVIRSHLYFRADGVQDGPIIQYRPSDGRFLIVSDGSDDSDWSTSATAVGTTYKMCVKYQFTGDVATLYIDAAGGTYCTTPEAEADGADDYAGGDLDGLVLNAANDGDDSDCADFLYDNIEVSHE